MRTLLSDIERKILRVIGNYSAGRHRTPTIDELRIKTGRTRGGITEVLEVLKREEYIEGQRSDPDKIVILKACEKKGAVNMVSKVDNIFAASRWVLPKQGRAIFK